MEKKDIVALMADIDLLSNVLLQNKRDTNINYDGFLAALGDAFAGCVDNIDKIRQSGFEVDEQWISDMITGIETGMKNMDVMLLVDVMCFEVTSLLQAYVNVMEE